MRRRDFLIAGAASGLAAVGATRRGVLRSAPRPPLPLLQETSARNLVLTAAPGEVRIGTTPTAVWRYNDALPGPVIRMMRGEEAHIRLRNALPEPTITHWHGLMVPEAADGHPRLAIPPGGEYTYTFTADQAAGLGWYHPHTHMRTGWQVHQGLAGLFIIDEPNAPRGLPDREHELALVIQDRTIGADGSMPYDLRGPAMMAGYFGDTVLVNGAAEPEAQVNARWYRLRVLNGSASRIYDLGFSPPLPMRLIAGDGGFLTQPVDSNHVTLAPAERTDFLVDFGAAARRTVTMETRAFTLPEGTMGPRGMGRGMMMMRGRQGDPAPLVHFVVGRSQASARPATLALPARPQPLLPRGATERKFVFSSMMMDHTINGQAFDMTRRDVITTAGAVERWTVVNDGPVPHPVHLHAAQFLVRARSGGRNQLFPWESGWKDTVLVAPSETVTLDVHFSTHRGLFLLHCHNLVHEDMGMMLNVAIE